MSKPKQTHVYLLIDPETGAVRYVGKSGNPKSRYKDHIEESRLKQNTAKKKWIFELLEKGSWPKLLIVSSFTDPEAARRLESQLCHEHIATIYNIHDPAKGAKDLKRPNQ
jgi:hypothetical protein